MYVLVIVLGFIGLYAVATEMYTLMMLIGVLIILCGAIKAHKVLSDWILDRHRDKEDV